MGGRKPGGLEPLADSVVGERERAPEGSKPKLNHVEAEQNGDNALGWCIFNLHHFA